MTVTLMPENNEIEAETIILEATLRYVRMSMMTELNEKSREMLVLIEGLIHFRIHELWMERTPIPAGTLRDRLYQILEERGA